MDIKKQNGDPNRKKRRNKRNTPSKEYRQAVRRREFKKPPL